MNTLHVKKGDTVLVLSGNDRGKQGQIKVAFPRNRMVIVEGVNLRWQHRKPTQKNPKGERIQEESPIDASKVRRVEAKPAKKAKKTARGGAAEKKPKKS